MFNKSMKRCWTRCEHSFETAGMTWIYDDPTFKAELRKTMQGLILQTVEYYSINGIL